MTTPDKVANHLKEYIGYTANGRYFKELFDEESPFFEIKDYPNMSRTPHIAVGSIES